MSGRVGVVGGLGIVKPTPANLVCFRLYLVFFGALPAPLEY